MMATIDKLEMQRIELQIAKQAETLAELQFAQKADHDGEYKTEQESSVDACALIISVVWASLEKVSSVSLVVPAGTQVGRALELSGLLLKYQPAGLAIFGQRCDLTRLLKDGDRIELCRPLVVEPKAARRRRALHREKVRNIKKKMPIDDLTV
jgi:putative ubiquitin-RnfH superfamily antitoxin RatB of RatAB toxin-antitoxin module